MKKLFIHCILFTLAGMLFSSCGNFTKMSLTKRHYRPGYYLYFGGVKHNNALTTSTRELVRNVPQISVVSIAKHESSIAQTVSVIASKKMDRVQKIAVPNKIWADKPEVNTLPETAQNYSTQNAGSANIYTSESGHHERDENISFVLVVICAIFLPPLGVALMYGIHDYFWIDLILTLIFFFPGMIFALIVVLM